MIHKTTTVRISIPVQKKLKVYAAKAEIDIIEAVDASILDFIKNFPPSFVKKNKENFIKSKKQ